ncbi:hypothetical protein ACMV8I_18530 [Ewingella sp. S1.OA.A_B6]
MNRSDAPAKQSVPFGVNGQREALLPTTPAGDNTASYDAGFPPVTMILKAAGGLPPKGQDMNQILYELSALARWFSAGAINSYDAAFSASIGGYPEGSVVVGTDGVTRYLSTTDSNVTNPNTGGAGWFNISDGYLKTSNNLSEIATAGAVAQTAARGNIGAASPIQIPGKNRLLNSRFAVNQRNYVSGTALALGTHGLDAWKASTANSAMTFSATPFGAQTITITGSFVHVIETQDVPTGTYTLSWTGTAQARIYNVGASAPAYTSSPLTVSISGNANVNVEFNAGTLFAPQLESGTIPTAFEFKLFPQELALCQRRCFAMVLQGAAGIFGGNSTYVSTSIYSPVALRAIPTIALGGASISVQQPGVNTAVTTTAAPGSGSFSSNVISFNINGNWSGPLSPGVPIVVSAASALTIFSADL